VSNQDWTPSAQYSWWFTAAYFRDFSLISTGLAIDPSHSSLES